MIFKPGTTDYELSPYTGLTRESWIEAGKHLLSGIFQHVKDFGDPLVMPRQETKITYPHEGSSGSARIIEEKAEIFEALTRSLFIAAPLLKDDPELEICGYRMADYYKSHILKACTPGDPLGVGTYDELLELAGSSDRLRIFQQTVETCALVIGLNICHEVIWDTYTQEEKDRIADFLLTYAYSGTVPQNWRFFNMLDMAFLHMNGYPIDKAVMFEHASAVINYYVGDGWYRDGQCFDYYSSWAFNVYGPLWNLWYGYENAPDIAAKIEENSRKLMETYPDFFDRDGWTNMWGRSNIYRFAATSPFGAYALMNGSGKGSAAENNRNGENDAASIQGPCNFGLYRRICSGSLLQFLTREDFYYKGFPTMGFYGMFAPLVQGYSCAESPFWMGKAFLCLELPADHPFWTEKENNGTWESLREHEVKTTTLDGPGLSFSNHKANSGMILRTGKVFKKAGDIHGMWNYSKLAYHSKYPWEAENESMQYVIRELSDGHEEYGNVTFWCGEKDGVLYRRQFFNFSFEHETHWMQAVSLADFAVPYGIMRADRLRLFRWPVKITLGSFGFPDNGTVVEKKDDPDGGKARAIILKGKDSQGRAKQLAMTVFDGWDDLTVQNSENTNPDSARSMVICAAAARMKQYDGAEPHILVSQVITREDHDDFTTEELFPVKEIIYSDALKSGAYGPVEMVFRDGSRKTVDYDIIERSMRL